MDILQRVTKAARESDELRHHDHEAMARAAVATVFNWLSDPTKRALDAAAMASHQNTVLCDRIWSAMLAEMRKEAGF